ncbi:hypothetical protein A2533_03630 [Candidatus Falkowbacteria bacterium RIFOXYD2_FULL_35_9]|uniref:HTH cro/C1-type domain-containing protein n=1 Tax=Candidatus Falkowbacteria bacterium RIFOXYC2_FULL_36_12 TaxID=1798002 RepID=A0A1F5T384_9BACT|nr:MAG: hypothetical protein A2300_01180 [Candidatus Falkowbacteria bacterium RIFOXYB2_FULL_35_7]OGF33070.1 MAG: hypothetical protein A2223_05025 [Candidatus Falkowbacteria bacterium RIFOXYA2_FULL_35_8]OGF33369.1 MAG: hypothetical protein A2478_01555 [Candidatus Falkowbacteria bacterium RIFOXYC2_FULL_36_12]OGF47026.1 MAG: hypothetical protein A2533_03630 [Candidatus Falkowbacteria bacterium RIFOXYD2_FULL_35_9]
MANFESKSLKSIETLGEILKKHRSELNLSMNQIARQFQINTRYLQALENDAYDQMPADIYTHNFLKKYASLLGLNASSLISLHEREKNLYLKTKKKDKSKINNLSLGSKFLNKILEPKKIKAFFILLLFVIILTYIGFSISKIFSPPELIIKEPSENSIITQNTTLEIKGVTEEEVELTINSRQVLYDRDGIFSVQLDLQKGLNVIKITAKKKHSQSNTIYKQIIVE